MAEGGGNALASEDEDVLIPCEFCGKLCPFRDIVLHESGHYGNPAESSETKRSESLLQESQTTTKQASKASEHRHEKAEIPNNPTCKILQHLTHDTYGIKKTGDGFVLKKISGAGDEKETAKKNDGEDELKDISNKKEEKIQQSSNTNDGEDELKDISNKKEEKIQQSSNTDDRGGKSENVPKPKESGGISHSDKKDDGDHFVRKKSFDKKESPKAQKPNINVHKETANGKSFAYDEDDGDLSDDNNPENETVEHFIWKALAQAENMKKTLHKSEEVGA